MSAEPISIDFTVVVSFEKKDDRYIACADQFGMIAFGKTKTEAEKHISEGIDLLNSHFRERVNWQEEVIRYLEARGVEYRIRTEDDDALETVEIPMRFGVTV